MRLKNNPAAHHESGSALIYVFIGIALFAALAFTFSRNNAGTSASSLTQGQIKLYATQILTETQTVQSAVNKLLAKGCSESDLKFYRPNWTGGWAGVYNDYQGPPQGRIECHVFYPGGGGKISPPRYVSEIFASVAPAVTERWGINGSTVITDVGSNTTTAGCPGCELVIGVRGIRREICEELNKQLGLSFAAVPTYSGDVLYTSGYSGTFQYLDTLGAGAGDSAVAKQGAFCFQEISTTYYEFVRVLIPR